MSDTNMALYVEGPRHYQVTNDNHGAKVLAAVYIMMCQTVLSVIARAAIKFSTTRKWGWDDTFISVAAAFAVGYTGTMAASYDYGLGRNLPTLSSSDVNSLEKTFYASNVLYLIAVILAKISILLFIKRLTPSRSANRVCSAFIAFLGLLGLIAVLVTTFACELPTPWQYESDHCINLEGFTRAIAMFDILTDVLLVAIPVYLFSRVNYAGSGLWTVIIVFSLRALIIGPQILRFINVPNAFDWGPSGNASWDAVPFLTWESVTIHYSVISASIPCVRPFLRSLESGLYDVSLKVHPRLARQSGDADRNLMLMTLSGFSVRKGMNNKSPGSVSTERPLRPVQELYIRTESPELERQQSVSSEVEFSQKLHPETQRNWQQTRIQSTRTYPQFGKLMPPSPERSQRSQKRSGESDRWHIAVTKETSIKFERQGVVLQELNSSRSNQATQIDSNSHGESSSSSVRS